MNALETNLEKRLLDELKTEDSDMHPAVDHRVSQLEQQLETISASMASFQQSQSQQNQVFQQQLVQMDQKVASQTNAFKGLLQQEMADQMRKIEALLKRGRGE